MSWTGEAYAEAARRDRADTDWYALSAESLFAEGAEWLRNQLRTDEAVELTARAILDAKYLTTWDKACAWEKDNAFHAARAAITALLGDN